MRTIILFTLLLCTATVLGQPKPDKNKAQLFKGTAEQKFEDARILFYFTGKVETLLDSIAAAHHSEYSVLKEHDDYTEYRYTKVNYPGWVYGNYNVHIGVKEGENGKAEITIWHTYYNKTYNITGKTLGQVEDKLLEFYQKCIDKALD